MISFIDGDLFSIEADILVNTINCFGIMSKGIALTFKKRYPEMFYNYQKACRTGQIEPGRLHIWEAPDGLTIVNFPTKRHWRNPSEYSYIINGLVALHDFLLKRGKVRVAIPALGCGNGGLDWNKVSQLITDYLPDMDADIFVFNPKEH